ncbi:hypothetical protein NAPIS_ORF02580 [Vairimorpha apis BRL 01]|uniref:Uncharacterized protein n=1 Tax=Vairimorpha apis BRL 01 TaxID=1037528 RepID=T0L575_9MICR|nr:hypothetical protein NAPIS_ORF02580 [Vairimorpha apis BRL 01]
MLKSKNSSENFNEIITSMSQKIDELKKESKENSDILNKEIIKFKNILREKEEEIEKIRKVNDETSVKDNTIKILKESLKLKDKLLNQKINVNKDNKYEINEDDVLSNKQFKMENLGKNLRKTNDINKNNTNIVNKNDLVSKQKRKISKIQNRKMKIKN